MRIISLALLALMACVTSAQAAEQGAKPAGQDPAFVVSAPPTVYLVTVTGSGALQNGRPFMDQGFMLTHRTTAEVETTVCHFNLGCLDLWLAETGQRSTHELDLSYLKQIEFGDYEVEVRFGGYEVPGEDVAEAKVSLSHSLDHGCTGTVSYEVMGAGFVDHVTKAAAVCQVWVSKRVTLDIAPAIAHSTAFKATTPGGRIAVVYAIDRNRSVQLFAKGYGGKNPDGVIGISLGFNDY